MRWTRGKTSQKRPRKASMIPRQPVLERFVDEGFDVRTRDDSGVPVAEIGIKLTGGPSMGVNGTQDINSSRDMD